MESDILSTIEFRISPPTPLCFLEHYEEQLNLGITEKQLSRYLTELALIDYQMIKYSASTIAACAVYLCKKFLKQG